jgi:hypothetical protein
MDAQQQDCDAGDFAFPLPSFRSCYRSQAGKWRSLLQASHDRSQGVDILYDFSTMATPAYLNTVQTNQVVQDWIRTYEISAYVRRTVMLRTCE